MDIEGLGPSIIETFVNEGMINKVTDIYHLDKDEIAQLDGFQQTSANNIISSVEGSKNNDLGKLIFAFGIRHIGAKAAKLLSDEFNNIDNIINASKEALLDIEGFGEIMADAVYDYFHTDSAVEMINELKAVGVNMQSNTVIKDDRFSNMTFVLTGTLPTYKRSEAAKIIESFGGKTSSSVSKKTTYVLAGEAGGSKLDKAAQLGIPVIDENEFNEMIK